jgi:hypothetical protein
MHEFGYCEILNELTKVILGPILGSNTSDPDNSGKLILRAQARPTQVQCRHRRGKSIGQKKSASAARASGGRQRPGKRPAAACSGSPSANCQAECAHCTRRRARGSPASGRARGRRRASVSRAAAALYPWHATHRSAS